MGVALPANVQTFLNSLRGASSIDTEDMIHEEGEPTADEEIFEEEPDTYPLNDNLASIGYESMNTSKKLSKVSTMFAM